VSAPEFSFADLLRDDADRQRKQAERARVAALLAETAAAEKDKREREIINEHAEMEFGKERAVRIRGALKRIGADMRVEAGFRCFVGPERVERGFDNRWIEGIEWLEGFDGTLNCRGFEALIIIDEVTRNDLVCGLIKDMIALGEKLPREMVLWCVQHGIFASIYQGLTVVAFERSQILALAYSEIFVLSMVLPHRLMYHLAYSSTILA